MRFGKRTVKLTVLSYGARRSRRTAKGNHKSRGIRGAEGKPLPFCLAESGPRATLESSSQRGDAVRPSSDVTQLRPVAAPAF